jgi:hypothetical protein
MSEPQPTDADTHKPLPKAVEEWVQKKTKPGGGGNYAHEADRVLTTFIDWTPDSVETVRDVSWRTIMHTLNTSTVELMHASRIQTMKKVS